MKKGCEWKGTVEEHLREQCMCEKRLPTPALQKEVLISQKSMEKKYFLAQMLTAVNPWTLNEMLIFFMEN